MWVLVDSTKTAERAARARSRCALLALLVLALAWSAHTARAAVPVTLYQSFAGRVDFTGTGNTLRASSDAVDPCALVAASSATLTIPAGATIQSAYLYWAGSGTTVDSAVTLNATAVTADRTFTETFSLGGTDYDFFAGFTDVTALVGGSGLYTFSGLSVNSGAPHGAG